MKCPGQDTKYWKEDAIFEERCPRCSAVIEFFKDDTSRKCRVCGKRVVNPHMDFGCASYCQYAEQCIGTLPDEYLQKRDDLMKDRVAVEMKRYFKSDFRRIGHAARVAQYAEEIGRQEGGNLSVILCAAYLHDIGIKNAEEKYNSTAPKYQELEGPPVARGILEKLGAKEELIKEVCHIIGHHHHPGGDESLNFKVLYDADLITNMEEEKKDKLKKDKSFDRERLERIVDNSCMTPSGRMKAMEVFGNAIDFQGKNIPSK
ncbi:MAG: HD domain-containing protein [Desulfamplus sp.]|nr:HD domain-containing protein [Desulfamplus sp.]